MKVMSVAGLVCIFAATVFWFGSTPVAQNKPGVSSEWPTYNHDLAATRYSPLTQINTDNVAKLTRTWSYKLPVKVGPFGGSQAVPIVVNGVMYLPAGNRVLALDPDT